MKRKVKKILKPLCSLLLGASILIFSVLAMLQSYLPTSFRVISSGGASNMGVVTISAAAVGRQASAEDDGTRRLQLSLFGVIPISQVNASVVERSSVEVLGNAFGIKIYTDGVLIVDMTDVDSEQGLINPAREAGLRAGDIIVSINSVPMMNNEQVAASIEHSGGEPMDFLIRRGGAEMHFEFGAVRSVSEDKLKAGLWVRDSTAGIGTLTFYHPYSGAIAGLGHGICDVDTGELVPVFYGEMAGVIISDVTAGRAGAPGELCGYFTDKTLGTIEQNTVTGVYGRAEEGASYATSEVALKQEISAGPAEIITTVDASGPHAYSCEIERINYNDESLTQNMIVRITDPELIAVTGGIVQGMSGSPIMQNGRLIGAVTHVFVNDPTRGYGIFAENMLSTAESFYEPSADMAS